jgi:ferric-dicitrate binding protein FerR (iron transport regulator)
MQEPFENIQEKERAAGLIAKYLRESLSDAEKKELEEWIGAAEWHRAYFQQCTDPANLHQVMMDYHRAADMEEGLRAAIQLKMGRVVAWKTWFSAAAAIIIILSTGVYFWYRGSSHHPGIATRQAQSIPPGRQGAILTLANGRQLTLDSLPNGVVAEQNGSRAAVVDGQLAYQSVAPAATTATYNTITTPRGRQYQVTLPDGTKVWLNAASRITFPTAFGGTGRKVEISGEAYFEVARDAGRPFKVSAGGADIEVLGTSFNINAYDDERAIKATLLDGSVKVSGARSEVLLKPGQQAVINEQLQVNGDINIEQVLAWKNGLFYFNSTGIATVMQQLSRWYDIDVRYEGKVPDIKVSGKMDKGLNLNEILEFLTKMEVKYRLLGRTVVITNN